MGTPLRSFHFGETCLGARFDLVAIGPARLEGIEKQPPLERVNVSVDKFPNRVFHGL
jgi:hypothetical protein